MARDAGGATPRPGAGKVSAVESALASLRRAVAQGDDAAAEAAVQTLLRAGRASLPALFALMQAADPDLRWWAVRALAEVRDPRVPLRLRQALHDPDPAVQQAAALGLRLQPAPEAVDDLLPLLSDADRLLARLAADALIAIGPPAVPALIQVIAGGPSHARVPAARALAAIGDPRAIPTLFALLDDPSPLAVRYAEEGLERLGVGMVFFQP